MSGQPVHAVSTLAVTDEATLEFAELVGSGAGPGHDPVAVAGGRTRWDVGGTLAEGTRVVVAPRGIVRYTPAEMTVQVRAGTTVAELDAVLAEAGQRSALPDRGGTVGGAVAVGENSLDLMGRGRVRDAVLQVRYVDAGGRPVTGGGPVVKNVTGFNLPKLLTGSLGTLGLFAEFVLRTNPIPPSSRWLVAAEVDPAAVLGALYRPAAVLWDGTTTWVRLEGHGVDLDAEANRLHGLGVFTEVDEPPPCPPHRWSLTPAEAARLDGRTTGAFVAVIGVGLVWAEQPAPAPSPDRGRDALAARVKTNFDPTGRLNPGRCPGH